MGLIDDAYIPSGVGSGWVPIVEELERKLAEANINYRSAQVKEKFGGLRVYLDYPVYEVETGQQSDLDEGEALIREAEAKAAETCEKCGAPGKLRKEKQGATLAWWRTLCNGCARSKGYKV